MVLAEAAGKECPYFSFQRASRDNRLLGDGISDEGAVYCADRGKVRGATNVHTRLQLQDSFYDELALEGFDSLFH